jgi:hypothetical protein
MMKVLLGLLLLLTSLYATAESSPISEIPLFNCPAVKLSASGKQLAKENHDRFAKLCLVCDGDDCAMRAWPADYETYEDLCRNTFCAPIQSKRARLLDQSYLGDHTIRFHYRISSAGEAELVENAFLKGAPDGKTAQEVKKDYDKFLRGYIQRNSYRPVVIDGSAKSIINLVDERSFKVRQD